MGGKGEANAVIAATSLPAMSLITSQNITIKKVSRKGLFANSFSEPAQVVGKVLAVPVIEGQVISKSFLISEGTGAQLAAVLQPGMRAVSVPVSASSIMGGLLYPGCLVDVIATFRLRYQDERGQAISTTLLHSVQVLAIQDESIISKIDPSSRSGSHSSEGQVTVTLMVDTRQAEALQLAMDSGKISLAMRNPLDQKTVDTEGMVLSQGRLAKLGELLAPSVYVNSAPDSNGVTDPAADAVAAKNAERLNRLFGGGAGGRGSQWQMTVIRGREVREEATGLPATESMP
jgi:pilus assembly protein CpaB